LLAGSFHPVAGLVKSRLVPGIASTEGGLVRLLTLTIFRLYPKRSRLVNRFAPPRSLEHCPIGMLRESK
jgi:hypothetical protein